MKNKNQIKYNWDGEEGLIGTIRNVVGGERSGLRRLVFIDNRAHFINNPMGLDHIVKLANIDSLDDIIGLTIKFNTGKYGIIDRESIEILEM